jgi:hypothetical protein
MAGEVNTVTVLAQLLPTLHADSMGDLAWWTQSELIQYMDESVKSLSHLAQWNVERDSTTNTAASTATYPLNPRNLATLYVSYGTSPLRAAAQIEMEARDSGYQTTPGTPDHWYLDKLGNLTIGLAPVPTAAVSLPVVASCYPPDLDVAQVNTLVQAPAAMGIYLSFATLAKAYGHEGESEIRDVAAHCRAQCRLLEQVFQGYFGRGAPGA